MKKLKLDIVDLSHEFYISPKGVPLSEFTGRFQTPFRGRGLEFADYRQYTESDDAELIDWKASLRGNRLVIKEYVEERNVEVLFLFDVSSTMLFGTSKKQKHEFAAEFVGSFSSTLMNGGDFVGLCMFSDKMKAKVSPGGGRTNFQMIVDALTNEGLYGGACNMSDALKAVTDFVREGTIVFIVSDFIELGDKWEHQLKLLSGKCEVIGVMVRDPLDEKIPDVGKVLIYDSLSGGRSILNTTKIGGKYERYVRKQTKGVMDIFLKSGAEFLRLSSNKSFVGPLLDFLKMREV